MTYNAAIQRSEFIVALHVTSYCFSFTVDLSHSLQSSEIDISEAMDSVQVVLETFEKTRENAETIFQNMFETMQIIATTLEIEIKMPRTCSRQTQRENVATTDCETYNRVLIFVPFLDHIITELRTRFSDKDPLQGLIPSKLSRYSNQQIIRGSSNLSQGFECNYMAAIIFARIGFVEVKVDHNYSAEAEHSN